MHRPCTNYIYGVRSIEIYVSDRTDYEQRGGVVIRVAALGGVTTADD